MDIHLTIETQNVPYLDNYDLAMKLRAANHPTINDIKAIKIIEAEIENRKNQNTWNVDSDGKEIN